MRVGRNESCPCGSGKKFKSCCEGKASRGASRGLMLLVGAIGAVAIVGLVSLVAGTRKTPTPPPGITSPPSPRATAPQPEPAPAGKVWSQEHGHWHDAAPKAGARPTPPAALPTTPQPQPPGPVPAGKVWSPEHGHWHDAPPR